MEETRVRFIHLDRGKSEVQLLNKYDNGTGSDWVVMTIGAADTKAVVMEYLFDRKVTGLKLLHMSNIGITPGFFKEYQCIRELEIACPVPINLVYRHLSILEQLRSFRLKKQAFSMTLGGTAAKEYTKWTIRCPRVECFRVSYDTEQYNRLPTAAKAVLDARIMVALRLAQSTFPGLKKIKIKIPARMEAQLEPFLQDYPLIAAGVEKSTPNLDGSMVITNIKEADAENHGRGEFTTTMTLEDVRELRKHSDDRGLKKTHKISFQDDDSEDDMVKSDIEVSRRERTGPIEPTRTHSAKSIRNIWKLFKTKKVTEPDLVFPTSTSSFKRQLVGEKAKFRRSCSSPARRARERTPSGEEP